MVIISALPAKLLQSNFESYRPDKVGGAMPIRFIPDKVNDTKPEGKKSTVKIVILTTVTKSLNIFTNGNAEAAIELIQVHESIVADKKLNVQYKDMCVFMSLKKAKLKDIEKDKNTNKDSIEKMIDEINQLKFDNVQLQEDVFDYFDNLLSPELTEKWSVIVKEECE